MNLNTEFISVMSDWCREKDIVWEYNSYTFMHKFIKVPSDPIERSLQECFGDDLPICYVPEHLMRQSSRIFTQSGNRTLSLTDQILDRIRYHEYQSLRQHSPALVREERNRHSVE